MLAVLKTKAFAAVAAGVVGIGLGGAAAQPEAKTVTKTNTVEVEKTVEVPVEKIVNREVEVEVTPQVCLDAIEFAREGFGITSETMFVMSDFIGAASEFDVDEMQKQSSKMPSLTRKLETVSPKFRNAAAACEAT